MRRTQILVVDDDALCREALERAFSCLENRIRFAEDASEAIAIVCAEPIDLVFASIEVSGDSGLDLVRRIHAHDPAIPCVVMTDHASPGRSLEALRAGADWLFEKPFEDAHLDAVRQLALQAMQKGRLRDEIELQTWAPRVPSTGLDFNDVVTRFENDLIEQALEQTGWNKNRAAQILRLNRTTLVEKIKKRGLTPSRSLL